MDTTTTTTEKRYVCNGTCGGSVTEEEFLSGKNVCSTDGCNLKGHPLVEKVTETVVTNKTEDDVIINNS
ncbi:MAG TPA: hypothetical protein VLG67_00400 [Candidatus Saccharimonadales bacterium]|nr:hypothetical protein [Candidatus Saccharimonadales bacterium]